VVAVFRNWKAQVSVAKSEVKRLHGIIAHLEAMDARLKAYCYEILERQPEPKKGARKLVGSDGSQIMLKGNGGIEPLHVDGWDPDSRQWVGHNDLPLEYKTVTLRVPAAIVGRVAGMDGVTVVSTEPDQARIREALASPCPACYGLPAHSPIDECQACGGSGRQGVPGARLHPRGSHIEVR